MHIEYYFYILLLCQGVPGHIGRNIPSHGGGGGGVTMTMGGEGEVGTLDHIYTV